MSKQKVLFRKFLSKDSLAAASVSTYRWKDYCDKEHMEVSLEFQDRDDTLSLVYHVEDRKTFNAAFKEFKVFMDAVDKMNDAFDDAFDMIVAAEAEAEEAEFQRKRKEEQDDQG